MSSKSAVKGMFKNITYSVVAVVVIVLIIAGIYFFSRSSLSSSTSSSSSAPETLTSSSSPAAGTSIQSNLKKDCGVVPASYMKEAQNNQNSPNQESLSCMSENLKDCFVSSVKFEGTATSSNRFFIVSSINDVCQLKYTADNAQGTTVKSMICDFKKSQIDTFYNGFKSISKESSTSLALSLVMAVNLAFNPVGTATIDLTDPNTSQKYSVPCTIQ